jgi:hypothetical protein
MASEVVELANRINLPTSVDAKYAADAVKVNVPPTENATAGIAMVTLELSALIGPYGYVKNVLLASVPVLNA